jgi:hypothetical protein
MTAAARTAVLAAMREPCGLLSVAVRCWVGEGCGRDGDGHHERTGQAGRHGLWTGDAVDAAGAVHGGLRVLVRYAPGLNMTGYGQRAWARGGRQSLS